MNAADASRLEATIEDALSRGAVGHAATLVQGYLDQVPSATPTQPAGSDLWVRANYLAGQVALAGGRLAEAARHLGDLLTRPLPPGELASRTRLMAAEACARLGRLDEARSHLRQVPASEYQGAAILWVRALRTRLRLERVAGLAEELRDCHALLRGRRYAPNRALLLCDEGKAWDRAGELGRAAECWEEADRAYRPGIVDAIRADVLIQLGRLAHLRGHLARALEHFEAAGAAGGLLGEEAGWRAALAQLDLGLETGVAERVAGSPDAEGLPEELRPLARLVGALLGKPEPAGVSREALAYLAARRGDRETARTKYAEALAEAPSPERRARLALALGQLAVEESCPDEGRGWLRQAEELARGLDMPDVLGRALQLAGDLAAEGPDDALARRLYEESLLVSEVQAGLLRNPLARLRSRAQRGSVLRYLLRSACRRGDPVAVFGYQEKERGRLVLDLLSASAAGLDRSRPGLQSEVARVDGEIREAEAALAVPTTAEERRSLLSRREGLLLGRDRLFEAALHRRSPITGPLPEVPKLGELQASLSPDALYLAPVLEGAEFYLLAVTRSGARLHGGRGGDEVRGQVAAWEQCVDEQLALYRAGHLGGHHRAEIDGALAALGDGPAGLLLRQALEKAGRSTLLVWAPDVGLHGLPLHAFRVAGRYLVEDFRIVYANSGAGFVRQSRTRKARRGRLRPALVVAEAACELPQAEAESRGVAASFLWSRRLVGPRAQRDVVRRWLARARAAHFCCHADFDPRQPLASYVRLPGGQKIHALDWLDEPIRGLNLVTLSACRSAEAGSLLGREVFGLVMGMLGGGVRAVVAGLWPVADEHAPPLMWRFYRHRLRHDLATALALAQRESLDGPGASPLFWAAFCLHGDVDAMPGLGWLADRRQRRHGRDFPGSPPGGPPDVAARAGCSP